MKGPYWVPAMPCSAHAHSPKNCLPCFTNYLVKLADDVRADAKNLPDKQVVTEVNNRYGGLKDLSKDDKDLIRSITRTVNAEILKHKGASVFVDPLKERDGSSAGGPITANERTAYRARLRQMGTWVGFTEFAVLAEMYNVRFHIMMQTSRGGWTAIAVDGGNLDLCVRNDDSLDALAFTGAHYEVGRFDIQGDGSYRRVRSVVTNAVGDCGLESFLILYYESYMRRRFRNPLVENRPGASDFFTARAAHVAGDGVAMNNGSQAYQDSLTELREQLSLQMSQAQVDDAITAEGRIDYASSKSKDVELGAKVKHLPSATAALPVGLRNMTVACRVAASNAKNPGNTTALAPVLDATRTYYDLGGNFSNPSKLLAASAVLLQKDLAMPKAMDSDDLYAYPLGTGPLDFLGAAAKALTTMTNGGKYPTHVMACLFRITSNATTYNFMCAAANMHDGPDYYISEGNGGTHSEKVCFLIAAGVLRAFGVPLVFDSGRAASILPPSVAAVDTGETVTAVDFAFLNIADFCGPACRKTWPPFRAALLKALPKKATVTGTVYYALSGAEDWFKSFR
ncbi:hypothetical protein P2318_20115 [Myxococcaceae bacterium GXIMD 01537]